MLGSCSLLSREMSTPAGEKGRGLPSAGIVLIGPFPRGTPPSFRRAASFKTLGGGG